MAFDDADGPPPSDPGDPSSNQSMKLAANADHYPPVDVPKHQAISRKIHGATEFHNADPMNDDADADADDNHQTDDFDDKANHNDTNHINTVATIRDIDISDNMNSKMIACNNNNNNNNAKANDDDDNDNAADTEWTNFTKMKGRSYRTTTTPTKKWSNFPTMTVWRGPPIPRIKWPQPTVLLEATGQTKLRPTTS